MIDNRQDLFRYMKFSRFVEMLQTKQISAANPLIWDDQYESFWKMKLQSEKGQKEFRSFINSKKNSGIKINDEWAIANATSLCELTYKRKYAICFSKVGDSEVMWRANSYENKAIMFKTTRNATLELQESNPDYFMSLNDIQYDLPEDSSLVPFLENTDVYNGVIGFHQFDDWFLHKRKIFDYEHETRLLIERIDLSKDFGDRIKIEIPNLRSFINGVMVHPLAEDDHVEAVKKICGQYEIPFQGKSEIYTLKI